MFAKICQDSRLMGDGKKRIDGDKLLGFRSKHGQAQGTRGQSLLKASHAENVKKGWEKQ
jgi:hypothetical protein